MNKVIVKLDFLLGEFVVVGVYFVDELPVEVDHSLEAFFEQMFHALIFALLLVLIPFHAASKVGVH